MRGFHFSKYIPDSLPKGSFDELLKLFLQLHQHTSSDAAEPLVWLNELDRQYGLTTDDSGIGDSIQDLKDCGYISDDPAGGQIRITPKSEQAIRQSALEEIFGK